MGLFDFIKKKLFGKTKEVEESVKIDNEKESIKVKDQPSKAPVPKTPVKEKISKKKASPEKIKKDDSKKGLLSKIKDVIVSSPEDTIDVVEKQNIKSLTKKEKGKQIKKKVDKEKVEEIIEHKLSEEQIVDEKKIEEVKKERNELPTIKEEIKEEKEIQQVDEVAQILKVDEIDKDSREEVKHDSQLESDEDSLKKGLEKTKKSFFSKLTSAVLGKSKIDDEVLDDLEEILITSDVGVETTVKIINRIEERVAKEKYTDIKELNLILKEEIVKILAENSSDLNAFDVSEDTVPYVIMVVGVNGVGKTTTIGKLAAQFKDGGLKVLIGAADTFRAAAVDQIQMWGEKVGVDVVSHGMNTDPASVAYDAVKKAVEENYQVVIIDTAGRLHTKVNLMNELTKIKRVVQKFREDAPHEVMLILDGSTGQNAFVQAEEFTKATDVNSITITKLDGTAKGGVVIGITDQFKIPIKYIGVGEKIGDLKLFHKAEFVSSFFD